MTARSERSVVAFLAFASILLAFGIDASLPAFDNIRSEFDLRPGSGEVSLLVTAYLLGIAAGQLFYGPVSDRFGRRPLMLIALAIYALGALGASLAPGFGILLGARFVWGFGAAGPSVLTSAIARDLYRGDRMARVLTLVMAVFLLGPMLAPLAGEALLLTGVWQSVFLAAVALAGVAVIWTLRFPETLDPQNKRAIDRRSITRGLRTAALHRTCGGYIAAMTFSHGAFYVFLGSSHPIIDEIYGRPGWFAGTFAVLSAINGVSIFAASRIVERVGAARVCFTAIAVMAGGYAVLAALALSANGVPSFWWWATLMAVTGTSSTIVSTSGIAVALEPMEKLAGMASTVRGVATQGGGALLAAAIDRQIDTTVTPMAVGGLIYGLIALAIMSWARGGSTEIVDPDFRAEPIDQR